MSVSGAADSAASPTLASFLSSAPSRPDRAQQQLRKDRRQARQQQLWEGGGSDGDDDDAQRLTAQRRQQRAVGREKGGSDDSSDEDGRAGTTEGLEDGEEAGREGRIGDAQPTGQAGDEGAERVERGEEDEEEDEEDEDGPSGVDSAGGGRTARGSTRDWERIAMERLKQQHSIDADSHEQAGEGQPNSSGLLGKRRRSAEEGASGGGVAGEEAAAAAASHARAIRQLFERRDDEQFESFDEADSKQRQAAGPASRGRAGGQDDVDGLDSDPWLQLVDERSGQEGTQQQQRAVEAAVQPQAMSTDGPFDAVSLTRQTLPPVRHTAFALQPFDVHTAKSSNILTRHATQLATVSLSHSAVLLALSHLPTLVLSSAVLRLPCVVSGC